MKNYLRYVLFALLRILASTAGFAQSGLTIRDGTDLFIKNGTVFSVDSLVLTPSADFTISGANALTRTSEATNAYQGTYISRVFKFSATSTPFSGTIGFYYRDAELNGLSENALTPGIHDGTDWNTSATNVTRDPTNNLVNTTGLTGIALNELILADECRTKTTYYQDSDGDTYGNRAVSVAACSQPAGYVTNSTDCDDTKAQIHPGATEVCNGVDDDCDGQTDEGLAQYTFYRDSDGDGYGTTSTTTTCSNTTPQGYASREGDCNDNDAAINPGTTEVCDGADNNCDGQIDEGVKKTYYQDSDGDGYGNLSVAIQACTQPQGYVADNTDCNDENTAIHPGATEVCNGIDDDCDGQIDEGVKTTWYRDADGDGYGNPSVSTQACVTPAGYVANNTDCNDNNASVGPGATEICGNGVDDNCDGQIDEGCNNKTLLSINDATVYESAGTVTLTITLSKKSTGSVTFNYTTVDGTAKSKATRNSSADFTAKSGTMTIPAGQQSATLGINIAKDNIQEPTEQFTVNLSKPVNASIGDGTGTVKIQNGSPVTTAAPIVANKNVRSYSSEKQVITGKLSVKVFPNPSANYFTIVTNSSSAQPFTVKVMDLLGRTLETKTGLSANGLFQIGQNYRTGAYIIQVLQGSEKVSEKLIKQNN